MESLLYLLAVAERFLNRKATIGELRKAVSQARKEKEFIDILIAHSKNAQFAMHFLNSHK